MSWIDIVLGIFLFQSDCGDSRAYSVLGLLIGSDSIFLSNLGFVLPLAFVVGYVIVYTRLARDGSQNSPDNKRSKLKVLIFTISMLLSYFVVQGLSAYRSLAYQKVNEIKWKYSSLKRAAKNADLVKELDLSYSHPRLQQYPNEI